MCVCTRIYLDKSMHKLEGGWWLLLALHVSPLKHGLSLSLKFIKANLQLSWLVGLQDRPV